MNLNLKNTLLEEAQQIFYRQDVTAVSEEQLIDLLDVAPSTFYGLFRDKNDFLTQVVGYDLERQKRDHQAIFAQYTSPVERMLALLAHGIDEMKKSGPLDFTQFQQQHPQAWDLLLQHLTTYSYPQIHSLLNDGILQKQFRGDINIELVTKIILEQMNLILNPQVFPPQRYNLAEVFRSIYLYYIRGICTDEGMRLAASHFSRF